MCAPFLHTDASRLFRADFAGMFTRSVFCWACAWIHLLPSRRCCRCKTPLEQTPRNLITTSTHNTTDTTTALLFCRSYYHQYCHLQLFDQILSRGGIKPVAVAGARVRDAEQHRREEQEEDGEADEGDGDGVSGDRERERVGHRWHRHSVAGLVTLWSHRSYRSSWTCDRAD